MRVENPIAFSFIMQDDIYLLKNEQVLYANIAELPPVEETLTVSETLPVGFNYLGGHKKNFLIIVHYPELEFIAEQHLTALESILNRLGFSLDDAAILNTANYAGATFQDLTDFFKPQKMLLLGKDAVPAGMEKLILNKPMQLNNCNTLFSFSFDEMMENNEHKKAFWEQMKQL